MFLFLIAFSQFILYLIHILIIVFFNLLARARGWVIETWDIKSEVLP